MAEKAPKPNEHGTNFANIKLYSNSAFSDSNACILHKKFAPVWEARFVADSSRLHMKLIDLSSTVSEADIGGLAQQWIGGSGES